MPGRDKMGFEDFKVLLVEDDRLIRRILSRMLCKIGFNEVVQAESAEEAWTILSGPDGDSFHILITDLTLPGVSGATLIDNVRNLSAPTRANIPVIVITGSSDPGSYTRVEKYGVSSYLVKPVVLDVLKAAAGQALVPRADALMRDDRISVGVA